MKLYFCRVSELFRMMTKEQLLEEIPECRMKLADSYKNEADQKRSLAASYLLGICMKEHGVSFFEKTDKTNAGKLFFPQSEKFYVNLSHADDFAVCACDEVEIGVDVEGIRAYKEKLFFKIASEKEKAQMDEIVNPKEKDIFFTRWWIRKESAVKLTGIGIAGLLDKDKKTAEIFTKEFQPCENCFLSVSSYHDAFCEKITMLTSLSDL
ncbi:MAG: 4'-phosphopantetheinyl transferase family protein [Lachnospiraceae bacterium]